MHRYCHQSPMILVDGVRQLRLPAEMEGERAMTSPAFFPRQTFLQLLEMFIKTKLFLSDYDFIRYPKLQFQKHYKICSMNILYIV